MKVTWSARSIEDRARQLQAALDSARAASDPRIHEAAATMDRLLEQDVDELAPSPSRLAGPEPDTYLHPSRNGRDVIIYRCAPATVEILWIAAWPGHSN